MIQANNLASTVAPRSNSRVPKSNESQYTPTPRAVRVTVVIVATVVVVVVRVVVIWSLPSETMTVSEIIGRDAD